MRGDSLGLEGSSAHYILFVFVYKLVACGNRSTGGSANIPNINKSTTDS